MFVGRGELLFDRNDVALKGRLLAKKNYFQGAKQTLAFFSESCYNKKDERKKVQKPC